MNSENWHKLTPDMETGICQMFSNGETLNGISRHFHLGDKRVRDTLVKNGFKIKNRMKKERMEGEWDLDAELSKKFPLHEGMHYVARAKDGGVEFEDYLNKSGVLTKYIKSKSGEDVLSQNRRITYFRKTGMLWYEDYFDIVEVPDQSVEYKNCPYCDWKTVSTDNRSGSFVMHLKYEHDMTRDEYLKEHPEDKEYLAYASSTLQLQYETDPSKFVVCPICGKKLTRLVGKHMKKHGIEHMDFISRYTGSTICCELHEKLSKSTTESNKTMKFHNRSKGELEIEQWLINQGVKINGRRKMVEGMEIDVYLPEHRIGIEFDGILYHTEEYGKDKWYHLNKTDVCRRNGIKLIHVFEDEYNFHKDLVLKKIGHIVGCCQKLPKIPARKCMVTEIPKTDALCFLGKNHLQGGGKSSVDLGAFYCDTLVGVMSFRKDGKDSWELVRFATDNDCICQGVGGKLFKHFVRSFNPSHVKSFADRRWTIDYTNNIYTKIGFNLEKILPPDYEYVGRGAESHYRQHKFGFRKGRLMKMDRERILTPDMTEDEMRKRLGYRRIWNCGLLKYVWYRE